MDVSDFAPILPPAAEVVEEPSLSAPDGRCWRREQCSCPPMFHYTPVTPDLHVIGILVGPLGLEPSPPD